MTTTTTDTTTMPPEASPEVPYWPAAYGDCLVLLSGARDREIAAQVLDQMTGEATSAAAGPWRTATTNSTWPGPRRPGT